MKQSSAGIASKNDGAAAFGRLCVETEYFSNIPARTYAAAFGRLCVETYGKCVWSDSKNAAAFGRLCVETL